MGVEVWMELVNEGRYLVPDVARWTDLSQGRVRRWLATCPSMEADKAIVQRHEDTPRDLVSFLDLVELHIIGALVGRGLRFKRVQEAVREAARLHKTDHPLARRRFLLDGELLFSPLEGTEAVLHLGGGGQLAFGEVIRERAEVLDFDPDGLTRRWWPQGHDGLVVVDPEVQFGSPCVAGTRIPTLALLNHWHAEDGDLERVAWMYELDVEKVRKAVQFEERKAA